MTDQETWIEAEARKEQAERRERIATAVLAGLCANSHHPLGLYHRGGEKHAKAVTDALHLADALINALDSEA